MKIAIASDDGITITGHVGKCEMFIVFDINNKEITNIEKRLNSFTMHKKGEPQHGQHNHEGIGAGSHTGIIDGLKDCNYLFCCSGGPGLIEDLKLSGIQTILTGKMEAEKAVNMFLDDKLENEPDRECKEHNL